MPEAAFLTRHTLSTGIYFGRWFTDPPAKPLSGRNGAYIHPLSFMRAPHMKGQFPPGAARNMVSEILSMGPCLMWDLLSGRREKASSLSRGLSPGSVKMMSMPGFRSAILAGLASTVICVAELARRPVGLGCGAGAGGVSRGR